MPAESHHADEILEPFRRGVELFREGQFFEAHESLEDFWNHQRGETKVFVQGLIQAAVACFHLQSGNVRGAVSLYRAGREKLEPHAPVFMDLRVDRLLDEMDALFGALGPGDPPPGALEAGVWPRPRWAGED